MGNDIVGTELYTRAASEPPHSELEAPDPTPEQAKAAIESNSPEALYGKARASGLTSSDEYEKVVGRGLTPDEERSLWDNYGDKTLEDMGR
jgi:hypothetical protein